VIALQTLLMQFCLFDLLIAGPGYRLRVLRLAQRANHRHFAKICFGLLLATNDPDVPYFILSDTATQYTNRIPPRSNLIITAIPLYCMTDECIDYMIIHSPRIILLAYAEHSLRKDGLVTRGGIIQSVCEADCKQRFKNYAQHLVATDPLMGTIALVFLAEIRQYEIDNPAIKGIVPGALYKLDK
jgi:hypothetical protein